MALIDLQKGRRPIEFCISNGSPIEFIRILLEYGAELDGKVAEKVVFENRRDNQLPLVKLFVHHNIDLNCGNTNFKVRQ